MKFSACFAILCFGAISVLAEPETVTTESGLQMTITARGEGAIPQPGEVVVAHYTGTLADGTQFDSSVGKKPFAFTLGKGQVIKGWDEAFAQLQVGDRATLVIPPELAYGEKERGVIPANSTFTFEVEFVDIKRQALADVLADLLESEGLAAAQGRYAELKAAEFPDVFVSEGQLNGLGYRLLFKDRNDEALQVFQWNVEQFPESGNVYDSLGEAWVKLGHKAEALANYRRSLELDPENSNAARFIAALEEAGDGPEALAVMQRKMALDVAINQAFDELEAGKVVDLATLQTQIDDYLGDPAADESAGYELVRNLLYLAESVGLPEAVTAWQHYADSPNPQVKAMAADKLRFAAELETPLELSFTAIDGREVDLAKLRGKVVLVDFWATWCGPCIEELPNVKRVYADYHEQGFEIVGVSLDRAGDLPKLKRFVAAEEMPWPQHYEGKKHNEGGNSLAARFAIKGIPAMLLVDKQGMIVSTNARGPKLEAEVKRLLAQ